MGFLSDVLDPAGFFGDRDPTGQEAAARESVVDAQQANELKRAQFDLLRQDAEPLRDLRNSNINRLLRMQGIFPSQPQTQPAANPLGLPNGFELVDMGNGEMRLVPRPQLENAPAQGEAGFEFGAADQSEFYGSPEFQTVRDAALRVQGTNPNQTRALQERAGELGMGEFANYQNRIFNTAGFSSEGLNNTNRLLQQNIDSQTNLLNNAGAQAAGNLIAGANQRGQAAGSIVGLIGSMMCDARLKKNVKRIGSYPSGIGKYQWEWTDEAKKLVGDQPAEGPMAHEVAEKQPHNIGVRDGYLIVKDARLLH